MSPLLKQSCTRSSRVVVNMKRADIMFIDSVHAENEMFTNTIEMSMSLRKASTIIRAKTAGHMWEYKYSVYSHCVYMRVCKIM